MVEGCFQMFFLYIFKLEWFKSKEICVDGNIYLCSQGPYRADILTETCQYYFVYRRVAGVHYFIFWEGGQLFLTL
jgi:hypothetical protein